MRVAVIGGGMVGLSAAYTLTKKGVSTTLFESKNILGGQCSAFEFEKGILLDKFYRHIFYSDKIEIGTIKELGIWNKVRFYQSRMGIYYSGRLYDFAGPSDLLKFKPFNLFNKVWFGVMMLYLSKLKNWRPLENVSAEDWLLKHAGKRIYKVIWRPLLKSKFDSHKNDDRFKKIPMSWFWSKIYHRMSTRKAFRKEMLGYIDGSFQVMIDELEKNIKKKGVVFKNSTVISISIKDNAAKKVKTKKGEYFFDKIICTIPAPLFKKITPGLPQAYAEKLEALEYQGALVMVLKLKSRLGKYYWLNICDDSVPFTLVVEHTNLVPKSRYNNKSIVYISHYTPTGGPYYRMPNKELYELYMAHLKRIYPNFNKNQVEGWWVFRDDYGTHIPTLGYSKKMLDFETPVKNLYIATGSQIYPIDRGVSESIRIGREVAKLVLDTDTGTE